ncbi:LAFE_0F03664g1_1 [Lachancea fermentati]|uniref:NADPH:adrenodoxin oxidoreductase, mitochondrial n=1 Tax=Lachancea fermentati TaxID=4955 RepID=A0A1G4MEN5_LACFM|nr:LAFE_0F03664g1_1 [Lachancea fermentati]
MLSSLIFKRFISNKKKSVSVIGSGPSGFYTVCRLLSKSPVPLAVTLWEKLPIPFGLSRYGVAPDHPEVKNCEDTFTECAGKYLLGQGQKHTFQFRGNVTIGQDVKLKQLLDTQDAVVLCYGCSGDHKLGIPGEDTTKGVFTSREFVNWYNGHPDFARSKRFENFDWKHVKNVGIIGNGNVALDIARVLLSNRREEIWAGTDINPLALDLLRSAPVENVKLIARRDFIHSKFTNKEFRELWELEKYGIKGIIQPEFYQPSQFDMKSADRVFKRRVEMVSEYLKPYDLRKKNYKKFTPPADGFSRFWELDYLKSPLSISSDNEGYIKSLTLSRNELTSDNRVIQLDSRITYDIDLLVTSLGYGSKPLAEFGELNIGFSKNHAANKNGYVLDKNGAVFPDLYACGWIRKGSSGVIASTMMDAFEVADNIIKELESQKITKSGKIDLSDVKYTTWEDWEKIDEEEKIRGRNLNKPRLKFLSRSDMLTFLDK